MTQARGKAGEEANTRSAPSVDSRRQSLELRLEDGYTRIDQAALAGADVSEWEFFWIRLLGEYEDVCRESDLAA